MPRSINLDHLTKQVSRLLIILILLPALLLCDDSLHAQLPAFSGKMILPLESPDGGDAWLIEVYPEYRVGGKMTDNYLIMPNAKMLKTSIKNNGIPNFTMLRYEGGTTRQSEVQGCPEDQGGLILFGISLGLTKRQMEQLDEQLKLVNPAGKIVGFIPLRPANARQIHQVKPLKEKIDYATNESLIQQLEEQPHRVYAAVVQANGSEQKVSFNAHGPPPCQPDNPAIVTAQLDAANASTFFDAFTHGNSLMSVGLFYEATFMAKIVNGSVVYRLDRTESHYEKLETEYKKWVKRKFGWKFRISANPFRAWRKANGFLSIGTSDQTKYSRKEVRSVYDFLREKELVVFNFDGSGAEKGSLEEAQLEAIKQKVMDHLWSVFAEKFTTTKPPSATTPPVVPPAGKATVATTQPPVNVHYFKDTKINKSKRRTLLTKKEVVNITLPVTYTFSLNHTVSIAPSKQEKVGRNAARSSGVKVNDVDCSDCVRLISLCDPAYQRREIAWTLDQNLLSLLSSPNRLVNSISMEIRHGDNYLDKVVLTPGTLQENRDRFFFVYSRFGEPDVNKFMNYEYRYKVVFNSTTGLAPYRSNGGKWAKSDESNLSVSSPHDLQVYNNRAFSMITSDLDTLRKLGIASVRLLVKDKLLGKSRRHSLLLSPFLPDAVNFATMELKETSSARYEYVLVYKTSSGQTFSTAPAYGEWGDVIPVLASIPADAQAPDNTLRELLPTLTDLVKDWIEGQIEDR